MRSFLVAFFCLLAVVSAQTNCGPPQCYFPCTNAKPIVDFVFFIDISGSMATPISGVNTGLTHFVETLSTNITAYFSLLYFGGNYGGTGNTLSTKYGGAGYLVLNHDPSASDFVTQMQNMVTYAGSSQYAGGVEPGLEAIRTALNAANANNLNINYATGLNNKKVFIIVTNEDSDPPVFSANLFSTSIGGTTYKETTGDNNGYCLSDGTTYGTCNNDYYAPTTLSSDIFAAYQAEINAAATALLAAQVDVYMFVAGASSIGCSSSDPVVPGQTCLTRHQYCDPDNQVQNTDYTGFNGTLTYNQMTYKQSLQGQMIAGGGNMRCFPVAATGNTQYVDNFFAAIVADLSLCQTACYDYICLTATTCSPPVNECGCDGLKYSGKVSDGYGGCCWANLTDCAGQCIPGGTGTPIHSYDSCGVCTTGGALDSYCAKDCAGNYYLTGIPPGSNRTIPASWGFDAAGYLLMNPTAKAAYISAKTLASITQQFLATGMFQGLSECTFDLAYYNTQNSVSLSLSAAELAWLASLLTTSPKLAQCVAGSQKSFPPDEYNSCDVCVTNTDAAPYCVKDCAGNWQTSAANAWFTDNCGYCVAPGTNASAHEDSCGVCNGGNAEMNQCGQCYGVKTIDACGNFTCANKTCPDDCAGVPISGTPVHVQNKCGTCYAANGSPPVACDVDCAGVYYNASSTPPHHLDNCSNCVNASTVRLATCVQDCSGAWNGTAYYDLCGQCVVGNKPKYTCEQDCSGEYYLSNIPTPHVLGVCGVCVAANVAATYDLDNCGQCTNAAGYQASSCSQDCKGVWSLTTSTGRAFYDICGKCWAAVNASLANSEMDSCGNCPGALNYGQDNSGVVDSQGVACPCGVTLRNCSGSTATTCNDQCPSYCPGTTILPNACGLCPSQANYPGTDKCGVCCNASAIPDLCNSEIDSCGVCFGNNVYKNNPCKICDKWFANGNGTCVQDCSGSWTTTPKTVGCDGVCGSNATCATTGNEAGGSVGAAVGGAIGGVAAIVALGLAAFFAYRYAQKNGLIGNAKRQVDFGASNSNPLYKSDVAVHQNPLYST